MKKMQKATGISMSIPVGITVGGVVSLLITALLAAVLAWMMGREMVTEQGIGIASAAILVVSAFCGPMVAFSKIRHRRLLVCMLTGTVYYLMLLCCAALFFGGQYQGMGVTALTVLGGCSCAALIGIGGGGHAPQKHRRKMGTR